MKLGSDCSGSCKTCYSHFSGGCIAGHGDDHYDRMTREKGIKLLSIIRKCSFKDFDYDRLEKAYPGILNE